MARFTREIVAPSGVMYVTEVRKLPGNGTKQYFLRQSDSEDYDYIIRSDVMGTTIYECIDKEKQYIGAKIVAFAPGSYVHRAQLLCVSALEGCLPYDVVFENYSAWRRPQVKPAPIEPAPEDTAEPDQENKEEQIDNG